MATTTPAHRMPALRAVPRRRFVRELERPSDAFAHVGPNWFASVMGTGIVANAAALLPVRVAGLHELAVGVWVLAVVWLVALVACTATHWVRHAGNARAHASNPAMLPFYGTPPMALMTVGAGALLVGHDVVGMRAAVVVAFVLWSLGTVGGLVTCALIPHRLVTRLGARPRDAVATWLLPVVPPMVSAATGAALIRHLPAGQAREAMLLACCALFGLGLLSSLLVIGLVVRRLAGGETGPVASVPTLFVVLGPLGQSVTAVGLLGAQAHLAVPARVAAGFRESGVLYGAPVLGVALLWLGVASALVLRAARQGLRFSLTWWSFTFPVGTVVTGTSLLADETGLEVLAGLAVVLFALLLVAWVTAAVRTAHGALRTGELLRGT